MVSRTLAMLAMLAVSACGDDDDSTPANSGGTHAGGGADRGGTHAGGGADTGGIHAGGSNVGGTAGGGPGGASGSNAGGAGGGAGIACANCVTTSCMSNVASCSANTDCVAILTCASPCRDQACYTACISQNPAGEAAFTPVITCVQTSCAVQCLGA